MDCVGIGSEDLEARWAERLPLGNESPAHLFDGVGDCTGRHELTGLDYG